MLRNYLKTAFRNLLREKGSTFINIAGLTLGITCSLVLTLMVMYMLSFDTYHTKRDRIYRIVTQSDGNQEKDYQPGIPAVLPDAFRTDFPEADKVVFTSYYSNSLVTIPESGKESKKYQEEEGIVFTEPAFFKIFDRKILIGDAAKGLDDPNEAVISQQWAQKYFGKDDAIGEVLKFGEQEYRITAIMENAPYNTDFPFDLMLSYITVKKEREEPGWNSISSNEQCYFLLKEGEDASKIESRLAPFAKKYLGEDDFDNTQFMLQPLAEMHFDDRYDTYSSSTVPKALLVAFGVIAAILIITACINFVNLATAEAIKRSKEVGIRKTLGSTRGQLIRQFLGETTLVTIVAVLLSLGLTQIALTFLNPFLDLHLSLDLTGNINLWFFIIGVTVMVSLFSGLYPAFVVSGYRPALALKNQIGNRNSPGFVLRRGLVVVQFFISQLFIIGTLVVISQMNYFQQKDLGFAKDAILFVPIPEREDPVSENESSSASKMKTLRNEMSRIPGVETASLSSAPPSSGSVSGTNFKVIGEDKDYNTQVKLIDGNYLELYELDLAVGKNVLDLDTATGFIVNEKLTRIAGFQDPKDMIGKVVRIWGKEFPVIGVVKDFHTVSLHNPIEATVLFNRTDGFRNLALKVKGNRKQEVIAELKAKWEAAYPEHLFEYEFLEDNIKEFYEGERKMSILLSIFSSMAIFIGCLGLFGLATFMANQKTKEIGVRKVLGASVESIVIMFSKEYVKLIALGFFIAAPIAWFLMNKFLEEFEYKISLGPEIFLLGLGATLLIAILTVGYKSFTAAVADPVKSLRYE